MLAKLGRWTRERIGSFTYSLGFFFTVVKETLLFFKRRQVGYKVLINQILFTGVEALQISGLMAIAIGAAIIVIGSSLLPQFGQSQLMYSIMAIVIARELGPLLTAFIVIARSGTAIATELGNMVVDHEIEAYVSIGVSPISYLVVPRFIGMVASMILLSIYFSLFGLIGSFFIVQFVKPIAVTEYFTNLMAVLKPMDLFAGIIKSLVFGVIISVVASFQGLAVNRAKTEIPVAGIKAVGSSFMLCIIVDVVLTILSYL